MYGNYQLWLELRIQRSKAVQGFVVATAITNCYRGILPRVLTGVENAKTVRLLVTGTATPSDLPFTVFSYPAPTMLPLCHVSSSLPISLFGRFLEAE